MCGAHKHTTCSNSEREGFLQIHLIAHEGLNMKRTESKSIMGDQQLGPSSPQEALPHVCSSDTKPTATGMGGGWGWVGFRGKWADSKCFIKSEAQIPRDVGVLSETALDSS